MKFGAYFISRWRSLIIVVLVTAFVCLACKVCGLAGQATVFVGALIVCGYVLAIVCEYARVWRFYSSLDEMRATPDCLSQLHTMTLQPRDPEQTVVVEVIDAMGMACADEIEMAKRETKEQREFTEAWVHEIKTPLAAAMLVADRVDDPESTQLKREIARAESQVNQALWFARSLNPESDYSIREVLLVDIVRTVCRENARYLIEQSCQPVIDIDEQLTVFTDKKYASFIVTQAVVNSAKYGATRIDFSVETVEDETGSKRVALRVVDNGRGIPSYDVPRVFGRGFTGVRGREVGSSTGMGLYLAATLCKRLGLGLTLSSEEGQGTTVTVTFPLDRRLLDFGMGVGMAAPPSQSSELEVVE